MERKLCLSETPFALVPASAPAFGLQLSGVSAAPGTREQETVTRITILLEQQQSLKVYNEVYK